jgi:mRNA interferase MazF
MDRVAAKPGSGFIPERGNLIWLSFDQGAGHAQAGRRPAVVLSPARYNKRTGLAVVAPITSAVKGYTFEVPLPDGLPVAGVVLSDQLRSIDWKARKARPIASLPPATVERVRAYAALLMT